MTQTPTDALRLVPVEPTREQWLWAARIVRELGPSMSPGAMAMTMERLAEKAAPASPLPEGGRTDPAERKMRAHIKRQVQSQCSGITGELDPRLVEWGYTSLDEAITHLGKLLDDQAAFDGLAAPTGAK